VGERRAHVFEVNSSFWGVPRRKRNSLYRKIARRKDVEKADSKVYLTYARGREEGEGGGRKVLNILVV